MLTKVESKICTFERLYYIDMMSKYMAYKIYLRYIMYDNKNNYSLNNYYDECTDTELLTAKQFGSLYSKVEDILINKYNLVIANKDYLKNPIALVDVKDFARHTDINTTLRYVHNLKRIENAPEVKLDEFLKNNIPKKDENIN